MWLDIFFFVGVHLLISFDIYRHSSVPTQSAMQEQDLYTDHDEDYKNTPVDSPIPPPTFEQFKHILQGSNNNVIFN